MGGGGQNLIQMEGEGSRQSKFWNKKYAGVYLEMKTLHSLSIYNIFLSLSYLQHLMMICIFCTILRR